MSQAANGCQWQVADQRNRKRPSLVFAQEFRVEVGSASLYA